MLKRLRFGAIRALQLATYSFVMLAVCLYCECIGRVWCMWLAPKGSLERVRRANRLVRHCNVELTRLTLAIFNAELEIAGTVPDGRFIIVSNHQSIADIAILSSTLRNTNLKFVAKKSLGRGIPGVSLVLREWGSALVSRNGSRQDVARLRAMARQLEHWEGSVVVFPEGTRSRDGRLLPYKAAAVRIIAETANLPILPIAIDGTHAVSDLRGFVRNMAGARGRVTIGRPIPPEVWRHRVDEVVDEVREWTSETIAAGRVSATVARHGDRGHAIPSKLRYQ